MKANSKEIQLENKQSADNKRNKKILERRTLILLLSSVFLFFMPMINLITKRFEDSHIEVVNISGYDRMNIFISRGMQNWFYDLVAISVIGTLIIATIGFVFFFFARRFIENKKVHKALFVIFIVQFLCSAMYLVLGLLYMTTEISFRGDSQFTVAFIPLIISGLLMVLYFIRPKKEKSINEEEVSSEKINMTDFKH